MFYCFLLVSGIVHLFSEEVAFEIVDILDVCKFDEED